MLRKVKVKRLRYKKYSRMDLSERRCTKRFRGNRSAQH